MSERRRRRRRRRKDLYSMGAGVHDATKEVHTPTADKPLPVVMLQGVM